jgi:NAD-dependent dihydropyrimidine dehydrogenase PreA subunit
VLDIWSLPKMTDASVAVIAAAAEPQGTVDPGDGRHGGLRRKNCSRCRSCESLTFKNGAVSPAVAAKVKAAKTWKKLDLAK